MYHALAEQLCAGPIPRELGDLSTLIELYLGRNELTGELVPIAEGDHGWFS